MIKLFDFCKCGCGNRVETKRRKYFSDHYKNPPQLISIVSEHSIEEIKDLMVKEIEADKCSLENESCKCIEHEEEVVEVKVVTLKKRKSLVKKSISYSPLEHKKRNLLTSKFLSYLVR